MDIGNETAFGLDVASVLRDLSATITAIEAIEDRPGADAKSERGCRLSNRREALETLLDGMGPRTAGEALAMAAVALGHLERVLGVQDEADGRVASARDLLAAALRWLASSAGGIEAGAFAPILRRQVVID